MKYYNKLFLKSESFYSSFYPPPICLTEYLKEREETIEIANQNYFLHYQNHFNENFLFYDEPSILFYDELSHYILNKDGTLKPLDDYIFFKLRYYGTKFLDIANEAMNFFIEARKKFKENNYDEAIIALSQSLFHDFSGAFEYKDNMLRITYTAGDYEKIFEFYGVKNWNEQKFMKKCPTLIEEELYEESKGIFIYNTLWNHGTVKGKNYWELSITFTKVIQVK